MTRAGIRAHTRSWKKKATVLHAGSTSATAVAIGAEPVSA